MSTDRKTHVVMAAAAIALAAGTAAPQSLFNRTPVAVVDADGRVVPRAELRQTSFFFVTPPEPRTFRKHDIVYIIVDELTNAQSTQSLETEKRLNQNIILNALLSPEALIEGQLRAGNLADLELLRAQAQGIYQGEGDYRRLDRITTRLAARVIDVKPNGTLVVEARKQLVTDDESRTMILSGVIFQDDITNANSILSSQIADLELELTHDGELRKASDKGFVTKIVEAIFGI